MESMMDGQIKSRSTVSNVREVAEKTKQIPSPSSMSIHGKMYNQSNIKYEKLTIGLPILCTISVISNGGYICKPRVSLQYHERAS